MNTNLTIFTAAQIESMKFADLATEYNRFAVELGLPQIKKFADKTKGQARLTQIQAQYVEEAAEQAPAIELTNKEMVALRHIVANALENMGGTTAADLLEDNCSWFEAEDLAERAVITMEQAKGLIGSLMGKGLIGSNGDVGADLYLSDTGIRFAEANKEALSAATLSPAKAKAEKSAKVSKSNLDMEASVSTIKNEAKEGTIEFTLHVGIAQGHNTVGKLMQYIMVNHKRPRAEAIDEEYARHNIKWFVRKGHLKIGN